MKAKQRHKTKILEYLGNPENSFPDRLHIAKDVLNFKSPSYLYQIFTVQELTEIEKEGLDLRRQKYASFLARVDMGLFKRAESGDPAAAKLVYQRFEGWSEKQTVDLTTNLDEVTNMSDEQKAIGKKVIDLAYQMTMEEIRKQDPDDEPAGILYLQEM